MEHMSRLGSDTAQSQQTAAENTVDEPTDRKDDVDWRSYVAKYNVPLEFPFEIGETVWILKPSFRAPLGPYKINRALVNNKFELKEETNGAIYAEEVEARFLRRDPDAMS